MSRRHGSPEGDESATMVPGSLPSASQPSPSVPVQETNILQILGEHLPKEHAAVVKKITSLTDDLTAASKYREQLERIASDAGVTLSLTPLNG